jgi:hypothetical protein
MATDVWNVCARATRSGPSINTETLAKFITRQSKISSPVGDVCRGVVTTPPRKRGGFVRNAYVHDHYVTPNRLDT